jgi:hypothetical protein
MFTAGTIDRPADLLGEVHNGPDAVGNKPDHGAPLVAHR